MQQTASNGQQGGEPGERNARVRRKQSYILRYYSDLSVQQ